MKIEIVDYDPRWPELAGQAIGELTEALPETFTRIEHIGSTSVPGLAAKPVIDLMAGVDDLDLAAGQLAVTAPALGYVLTEAFPPGRLFYLRDRDGRRTHHLHVVPEDTFALRNEVVLRNHLRQHAADAARYGALKRSLVAADPGLDGDTYTRMKTDLIQELVDTARAELGLPSITVWEE